MAPLGIEGHAVDDKGTRVRQVITRLMLGERARQIQDDWMMTEGEGNVGHDVP